MKQQTIELNVDLNDIVTPISCARMVIEFIKYIVYQKQLIPYPYERLKLYINKQTEYLKSNTEPANKNTPSSKILLSLNKSFKLMKEAYDTLENIFLHVKEEIMDTSYDRVEEIVILLGSSILTPQDIFHIQVPQLKFRHSPHYHSSRKLQECLFRNMMMSEQFHDLVSNNRCQSNLYMFLKMKQDIPTRSPSLIPRHNFNISKKGQHAVISFNQCSNCTCSCLGVDIFQDEAEDFSSSFCSSSVSSFGDSASTTMTDPGECSTPLQVSFTNESDQISTQWYQLKNPMKSFTDVKLSGISVTDIWLNPNLLNELS